MLFEKFDFPDDPAVEKFFIEPAIHQPTWKHYYNSYNYVLFKLIERGLTRHYVFNCRARPILFLLRHSLELCLKNNLYLQTKAIPIVHDFKLLYEAFHDEALVPSKFKEVAEMLNFDSDGSAFRYHKNINDQPYFTFNDTAEVAKIIRTYHSIETSRNFVTGNISPAFQYNHRRIKWDLTFHLGECRQLAHIRTQYDQTIEFIVEGVLLAEWDINHVYLPLMFLIRHSIEIALKYNIEEVQRYAPSLIDEKNISHEHSLVRLYNIYKGFLADLDTSAMEESVRKQLTEYDKQYTNFNRELHDLDINSRYFRFPVDKKGARHRINARKIDLVEILKLYSHLDPFITFTNDVLEEQGLLFRYDME